MNEAFLIGKVVLDIDYRFIYNTHKTRRKDAIAITKVRLENNSIIKIEGYNEIADAMYRKIKIKNVIFIHGKLIKDVNENMIIIRYFKIL